MNTAITTAQISAFRREALAAGDKAGAKRAAQALAGNKAARRDIAGYIATAAAMQD